MNERLTHQRSKGPASTPAQRLVELQNALSAVERERNDATLRADRLQADYDRWHTMQNVSFAGVPMAQIWADLVVWESVLNDNPDLDAVFEIGTWQGGFSWWLWAQCEARDMFFGTFDAVKPERDIPGFMRIDVFAEVPFLGKRFRAFEPCLVFCDGGNKPRELSTFAAELRDPRSLLAVHDWGTEIVRENAPDGLTMVYKDFCEQMGSVTRFFRLRDTGA
jgi:hypothetical protein